MLGLYTISTFLFCIKTNLKSSINIFKISPSRCFLILSPQEGYWAKQSFGLFWLFLTIFGPIVHTYRSILLTQPWGRHQRGHRDSWLLLLATTLRLGLPFSGSVIPALCPAGTAKKKEDTGYSFLEQLRNFLHELFCQFISWTKWANSGKFVDNCWISWQVIVDMKKVYNDLMIINLHQLKHLSLLFKCFYS